MAQTIGVSESLAATIIGMVYGMVYGAVYRDLEKQNLDIIPVENMLIEFFRVEGLTEDEIEKLLKQHHDQFESIKKMMG